jgi:Zn-dependent protease/CBS domain-containing protein
MSWSFKIAKILGIEVRIHVTFFLLLAFVGLGDYQSGGMPAALGAILFVCLIFLCVLLHEFGHALAARRYGIHTPDITMLPIGGVARLERMPDNPVQELVVAVAGPLVNVVIAAVLFLGFGLSWQSFSFGALGNEEMSLPQLLFNVNIMLVAFNMLPAFPMDGGRVLRALLAMRLPYAQATQIAANIGQFMAFGFGFYGLAQHQPMLVLVGVFVFFGAQSEAAHAQMKNVSSGLRVHAGMITQFQTLPLHADLNAAIDALLHTSQHDFPVLGSVGEVRGLLTRDDLLVALRKSGPETPVRDVMRLDVPAVHETMLFERAVAIMQESDCPALPVLDGAGRLVGLFTPENVGELLMVRKALAANPRAANRATRAEPPPLPVQGADYPPFPSIPSSRS